ncbi:Tim10/DDP family zinc finger protein ASCRUDRAFT_76059 [Ascoidea rubescens DSM 1968]|uniref:Mitochondrial import inner membrane translocase subunit n=1 Tax=Ascoidea rubescens DSM 1968 TaxID=1344418 RepID=A0A1D2VGG8_9ASCO|nr:hypothetical protein ASCRUDRAFT_76059 [Ascoidea rubescens DSM 1968]ODV60682.1 hypothetical protein ASCRUDRAFT_76059 [Ascoidea rubescens DSM 1968]
MEQLNRAEAQEFQKTIEQKQQRDFMNLYASVVQRCFMDCVNDFTAKNLTERELGCIERCTEKLMKHTEKVGQKFQEDNQKIMEMQMEE